MGLTNGTYTVTVTDNNACTASASIIYNNPLPDTGRGSLQLNLVSLGTDCGDDLANFAIMIAGVPHTVFNSCVFDILLPKSEYGKNDYASVNPAPNFDGRPGTDYIGVNEILLSDSVVEFQLGDSTLISPLGVVLNDTAQVLVYIDFEIEGCEVGPISFTNTVVTSHESTYTVDSTYNEYYSNTVYSPDNATDRVCPMAISGWTNPVYGDNSSVDAGTNYKSVPSNSSILTINGTGFGDEQGYVKVSNADAGFDGRGGENLITLDSIDILLWSENQIIVRMPSDLLYTAGTPGSGPFILTNACGESVTDNLQINYNILNTDTINSTTKEKLRPEIVMVNDTASFLWRCDTSIWNNYKARYCVQKAVREWNCSTGVNWKLGTYIEINDTVPNDSLVDILPNGISVIYFSIPSNFDTGVVMSTVPEYLTHSCFDSTDAVTFKDGADIMINPDTALHISYDTTGVGYSPDSVYFYDNILHELGHALGLGHINDTLSLMYWYTAAFRPNITTQGPYSPGPGTLLGALDMVNTSTAHSPTSLGCGSFRTLVPSTCTHEYIDPTLSVPAISGNAYNLNLYPNPIDYGNLTITYGLTQDSYVQFKILDCTGRVIMKLKDEHEPAGDCSEQVNIDALAGGVYLFTANINGESQVIKFIKF